MKLVAYPILAAVALALIAAAQAKPPAPSAAPAPARRPMPAPAAVVAASDLPAAPERDLVMKTCTSCHTSAQFSGQRMSHDEWKETVVKMIGLGADVPEDKEAAIVDYLAKSFPDAKRALLTPPPTAPGKPLKKVAVRRIGT